MTIKTGTIGIIADDLTGANDTALQFHLRGCNTQLLFDYTSFPEGKANTQAWAISTETRNTDAEDAVKKVSFAAKMLIENLNIESLYKKIDSTLRGNVAQESLAVLEAMKGDAAIIVPAFPSEGRVTVGGYHLLKGIPLERTEVARDPLSPIYESHIPTLLKTQVDPELVAHIELKTVMRGAGPILVKIQEFIKNEKKIIVVDAISTTDMEQISLAIEKSNYNLLPCGSAGLAQSLTKSWLPEMKHQHIKKVIPSLPILIVSGSTTNVTKTQITRLIETDEFEPHIIELNAQKIFSEGPSEQLIERIVEHLKSDKIVLIHSVPLEGDIGQTVEYAAQQGIQSEDVPGIVSDYLAEITRRVVELENLILVSIGGETSYKCCKAIESKHLQIIDEVEPAIPLCLDHKAQWIVTKSGNLGSPNTLVNIVKYFKKHQQSE